MARLFSVAILALASSAAAAPSLKAARQTEDTVNATVVSNVTLSPIPVPLKPDCLVPQTNVSLDYGLNNTDLAAVNVTLFTSYPTILLETISNLTAVDCSSDSVAITFNNAQDLDEAYTQWSSHEKLLLITNHMGDCDTEFERGFFVAGTYTTDTSSLSLTVTAEKTDVHNVSSYMKTQFHGLPAASTVNPAKRDVVIDPGKLTYNSTWNLPSQVLYEYDPYVTVTAQSGQLDLAVGLSGYLEFDVLGLSLDVLSVDFETQIKSDLVLELGVTAPYNNTFAYTPDALAYYIVNVPGIITFGPELLFSIGADLDVAAAVDVVLDVGSEIENGTVHIDFVDWNATAAAGWEPTYHANVSISEKAEVAVSPFVSFTVGVGFELLGGALDLSGGLTPKASFPTTVTLDAGQDVSAGSGENTTVSQPGGEGTCENGAAVVSDFEFSLTAFVTQWYKQVIYDVKVPIADECYSWA
ncbi:isoamyl alcohol [Diaporthe amygdali]|uniref:isoamyl alcohol n=1 Tax=Phomopsis amygdali TaxID=1214568 RepID=UPI0022FEB4BE|nr:isoamyl alcohol [Diaporthe amygdali]KAJ0120183.1 isoamyl alcohol [Diaporthe amygdali]